MAYVCDIAVHIETNTNDHLLNLGLDVMTSTTEGLVNQEIGKLLIGRGAQSHLLPQIGSQIGIGLGDGSVSSLGEVTQSAGGATGRGITILNTSHHQQLLGDGGRDNAGTTGSWDQTHRNGTALASDLAGHGMGFTAASGPA